MYRFLLIICITFSTWAQAAGTRLRLDSEGGQRTFRIGQAISLTLNFETDSTADSSVLNAVKPRRLRPQTPDEFWAEPATGWVDPLQDLTWTMEGGASNFGQNKSTLNATHPVVVKEDLNEFVVFQKPGHYVLHCRSSRLQNGSSAKLESTALALDILPRDDAETARLFEAARSVLEAGKPPKEPQQIFYLAQENAQTDAVRTLRYLDTEAAGTYLASLYGQGRQTDSDIEYALFASTHRESVTRDLERHLGDPDLVLTQTYLIALTQLKSFEQARKTGRALLREEWMALDEVVNKRVFELAAQKTPQAKADTYYYLFETGSQSYRQTPQMRQLVVESLPFASASEVSSLLSLRWSDVRVAGSQLVPFLKQAVARNWPKFSEDIAGLALLRLAELDPQSANDLARVALLSGDISIGDRQLIEFSVPISVQLDQALLAQYRQGKPVDARIARFASPREKDAFARAWEARTTAGRMECTALFAYFFRVDPQYAQKRLLDSRKSGACTVLQFPGLERRLMSPGLEQHLIEDTKDANPNGRTAAYRMLSMAGSPAAFPALFQAAEQTPGSNQEIVAAILQGRNWFLSDADYARLTKICTGRPTCSEISRIQRESAAPYTLRLFNQFGHQGVWLSNREVDSIADLDTKLSQYPAGAVFRWQFTARPVNSEEQEMRQKVETVL